MDEDIMIKSSVGVIGAGIQGVCISLSLIKKGFKVTLVDREEPGKDSWVFPFYRVVSEVPRVKQFPPRLLRGPRVVSCRSFRRP